MNYDLIQALDKKSRENDPTDGLKKTITDKMFAAAELGKRECLIGSNDLHHEDMNCQYEIESWLQNQGFETSYRQFALTIRWGILPEGSKS